MYDSYLKLLPILAMGLMFDPYTKNAYYHIDKNDEIDKMMELLIKGKTMSICREEFSKWYNILPNKMRGTVIFSSDVKTREINIKYIKK